MTSISVHQSAGVIRDVSIIGALVLVVLVLRIPVRTTPPNPGLSKSPIELHGGVITIQERRQKQPSRPSIPIASDREGLLLDETIENTELEAIPPIPTEVESIEALSSKEDFFVFDQQPSLIGGNAYLRQHIQYPAMARQLGFEGVATIQLLIDEAGHVLEAVVLSEDGNVGFGEAAIAVLIHARFKPAMQRNLPVKSRVAIPVQFKLR